MSGDTSILMALIQNVSNNLTQKINHDVSVLDASLVKYINDTSNAIVAYVNNRVDDLSSNVKQYNTSTFRYFND